MLKVNWMFGYFGFFGEKKQKKKKATTDTRNIIGSIIFNSHVKIKIITFRSVHELQHI